ncbi:hypothetical protein CLV63_10327 [Murinocardiopsis flavida]|uniref:Uncharacterized protein n=1 Tax=Murinocardiopsis flavida TaxID=645275 RepID=A0A2P8DQ05_9ACTN|nr:hypothetical protein [Murinocardiopsis flavida]PSK99306.1 hypothetical protein CLV63_10327 [Murinocardiopsis flavida]
MILREFLYVDTDKVRSMQAQIDGGISENQGNTTKKMKTTSGGTKGILSHQQEWGTEVHVSKSFGDAMFPILEESLESLGILKDISEELTFPEFWSSDALQHEVPIGSIVRISALGSLFDARYVATSFANFATIYTGLQGIGAAPRSSKVTNGKQQQTRNQRRGNVNNEKIEIEELEKMIPDFEMPGEPGKAIGADRLRSLVRISRGMFNPGLHLNLTPTQDDRLSIGARLQEGRQYLDSDPEILFARYGTKKQEWTIVGTVGQYSRMEDAVYPGDPGLADAINVYRNRTAEYINSFMGAMGAQGFSDLPQYPGFSLVPFAVYRVISNDQNGQISVPNGG